MAFNISSKNLKWKQHFYIKISSNYLLLNMTVWWCCISRRGRSSGREGPLISNLVSHCWYDVEKLTVPGSSNLNLSLQEAQKKRFVLKRWEKNVLCMQIGFSKITRGRVTFLCRRSLLSKLIFSDIVSCRSLSHEIV